MLPFFRSVDCVLALDFFCCCLWIQLALFKQVCFLSILRSLFPVRQFWKCPSLTFWSPQPWRGLRIDRIFQSPFLVLESGDDVLIADCTDILNSFLHCKQAFYFYLKLDLWTEFFWVPVLKEKIHSPGFKYWVWLLFRASQDSWVSFPPGSWIFDSRS